MAALYFLKERRRMMSSYFDELTLAVFTGLCRGSTVCPSSCPCDFQMSLRSQSATRQQHTYDNMLGMNTLPETRSSRNLRRESPCSDPGGQVSRSTSYDRSSVSDWGEGTAATTDSVFVRDMEETFARTLSRLRKEFQRSSFTSSFNTVEEWLKSLDLAIYTTNFVENGYDDIDFLGGNILEDDDLVDMNVSNKDHRKKILESCHSLPALKPISEGQAPESVGEWLRSLHLDQYIDTFRRNGYADMDRTKKLWDVELKSDEVEKLAYQLNEEAERTEIPIKRLRKVMYGSTCADMQVDVMGECPSSIKHVVGREMANNQSVRRHLDAFTRGRIIGKLEEGRSVTSVAAEFGIAHSIVSRLWRQFQTTGTAAIRGFSSGRPR
ncbi:ankyrin repeat and sterile alpha motif domain-containing protein 1B [Trichonephila clavipes]|nr:ankyrin repeat and sterile alpha motif domain-containing protein 1B [Trichonephila clavipes]